jgi:DHA1 family bicyclomycin/chloramphenicol resistance-like MFS transporter
MKEGFVMTRKEHFIIILILGSLSAISPFTIDMYLPGFPSIASDLHASVAQIQLSLTSYFIGISIGQLVYGPLLDRYGRRLPLFIGLGIYIITSIGCVFVHTVDALIIMRFIQAVGGCVSIVASRALVRDLFPVSETAKIFSLLMLVLAVSPMLAPTVGGYVSTAFSWHAIFIILAVIAALILLACYFFLPEGRKADPTLSLKPRAIASSYASVFKEPQFYTYAITSSVSASVVYSYIAGSPDVFMNVYKADQKTYGWIFAFIALAIIGSSQVNRYVLKKWKSEQLIRVALLWQIGIGLFLILGAASGWFNLYSLIGVTFLFMCGQGFTVPNASALSLAPFSRLAGSASALLGALQLGMGSLASALVSVFHNGTALPMLVSITCCPLAALFLLAIGKVATRKKADQLMVEEETAKPLV